LETPSRSLGHSTARVTSATYAEQLSLMTKLMLQKPCHWWTVLLLLLLLLLSTASSARQQATWPVHWQGLSDDSTSIAA
jgi:hypothetical protein